MILPKNCQRGANYAEVAISLPLFILLCVAIIDMGRLFFAMEGFHRTASELADMASRLNMDTSIDPDSCATDAKACEQYNKDLDALAQRSDQLTKVISKSIGGMTIHKNVMYARDYGKYANSLYNQRGISISPLVPERTESFGLVRPGEEICYAEHAGADACDSDGLDPTALKHPVRAPGNSYDYINEQNQKGWAWTNKGETWRKVYRADNQANPVVIKLRGEVKPFFPFWGTIQVGATQIAYKQVVQVGDGGEIATPVPPPTPTVPPTPTNEPTPAPPTPAPTNVPESCSRCLLIVCRHGNAITSADCPASPDNRACCEMWPAVGPAMSSFDARNRRNELALKTCGSAWNILDTREVHCKTASDRCPGFSPAPIGPGPTCRQGFFPCTCQKNKDGSKNLTGQCQNPYAGDIMVGSTDISVCVNPDPRMQ